MTRSISTVPALLGRILLFLGALWLAACEPIPVGGGAGLDAGTPVPVALLVPRGSGAAGDEILAKNLENAARLAIADLDGVKIDLRVYPSGSTGPEAATAALKAVDEGARIILGPVYAEAANAAGVAVASRGVSVLAFSNNASIAGGNVFVLGNLFENTADRLVRYAVGHGKRSILLVHGNSGAETIGAETVARAVGRSGGSLAGNIGFDLSQQGVTDAVPGIVVAGEIGRRRCGVPDLGHRWRAAAAGAASARPGPAAHRHPVHRPAALGRAAERPHPARPAGRLVRPAGSDAGRTVLGPLRRRLRQPAASDRRPRLRRASPPSAPW